MNRTDLREAVLHRDQYRCANCLGATTEVRTHDPHHTVPRGAGGSNQLSNLVTLCRRCHDAVHSEDAVAPSVEIESSGTMTPVESAHFKHLTNETIPALARVHDVRLVPTFGLNGEAVWRLPLGDLRRLERQLSDFSDGYRSLDASEYMIG